MNRHVSLIFSILLCAGLTSFPDSALAAKKKPVPANSKSSAKQRTMKSKALKRSESKPKNTPSLNSEPDDIDHGWKAIAEWQPERALKHFDKASHKNPDSYRILWGYGAALGQQAKFPESVKWFERAVQKYPSNSRLLSDFGFAYMSWGIFTARTAKQPQDQQDANRYWSAAESKFSESLKIEPRESMTYSRLAMLNYYRGDYPVAWKNVRQSRKLGGEQLDPQFVKDLEKRMPEPK